MEILFILVGGPLVEATHGDIKFTSPLTGITAAVVGVILITLLQSILSVMQIPEMGRQIIYGIVIITMLLVYGRGRRHSD